MAKRKNVSVEYSNVAYTGQGDIDGVTLYEFDSDHNIAVSFENDNDHLEADGRSTTKVRVRVTNDAGEAMAGIPVSLETTLGTLRDVELVTDSNGNAFVDANENGAQDAGESAETILTAGTAGGFATISASTPVSSGSNQVLLHKVTLSNFTAPQFLKRASYSAPPALTNPEITFTVGDAPALAKKFRVTTTIYSLSDHDPVAVKTEELAAGTYTRSWNDFFYQGETLVAGKAPDAGDGIFPYQIEVVPLELEVAPLDENEIVQRGIRASDWKASKSLVVKPKTSNAYALSYDEETGKTYLTYIFDIENTSGAIAPTDVRVDVYDPDYEKIATVAGGTPTVSSDGRTFTYFARGEVNLESAGDYHFVIEAKDASEDKDNGKWALEQNSNFVKPPYVTFGARNKGTNSTAGLPAQFNTVTVAKDAAKAFESMGYGKLGVTKTKRWWAPNTYGAQEERDVSAAIGPDSLQSTDAGEWTAQYNAIWAFMGHGQTRNGAKGQAMLFQVGSEFSNSGQEEHSHLFSHSGLTSGFPKRYLDKVPLAYKAGKTKTAHPTVSPFANVRLMIFAGCWTANYSINYDLPSMAVVKGARGAVGFEAIYYDHEIASVMDDLVGQLKEGKSFDQTRNYVQNSLSGWHSGPFGNRTGRDEHDDLYKIRFVSNAGNSRLRTEGFRDAMWGWEANATMEDGQ